MLDGVRGQLTGAFLRAVAGIRDVGEVIAGFIGDGDGGAVTKIGDDSEDVYVQVLDPHQPGRQITARLYAPGGILWRLPIDGDSCFVLRPADADGPGVPYVLHGDGGAKNAVPSWLATALSGISLPEGLQIESTGDKVVIRSNAGDSGKINTITLAKAGDITVVSAGGAVTITADKDLTLQTKAGDGGKVHVISDSDVTVVAGSGKKIILGDDGTGVTQAVPVGDDLETRIKAIEDKIKNLSYSAVLGEISIVGTAGPYPIAVTTATVGPLSVPPFPSPPSIKSTIAFVKK